MIKKALRIALSAALLLALLCAPALAKVASPGPDFYYLDNANVLSEALEGEIFFSNQLLYDACGAQIVVVTLDSTGSDAIDDYSYDLFNKWGIGDADKQNGLLILLAIDDDDYYVLPGTGLRSKFSAGSVGEYNDKYLEPDFAAKDYEAGVKKLFEAVFARVADTYGAKVTVQQGIDAYRKYVSANAEPEGYGGYEWTGGEGRGYESDDSEGSAMMGLVIILVIVLIVVLAKRSSRRRVIRRTSVADQAASMYIADRMLRNAARATRPMHIPPRPSSGYRPVGGFGSGFSSGSRSSGSGFSSRSSGSSFSSRSSGGSSFRSSGGGFGGARGGGGGSRGGGAGRGRH